MATETLTQSARSFSLGAGINFGCQMKDQNGVAQVVDVVVNASGTSGTVKFNGWGPSTGTMSNITLSGSGPGGNPTKVTFDVAGTGNITGNGNDDSYSSASLGSFTLGWILNQQTHQYVVNAGSGTIPLTYTD